MIPVLGVPVLNHEELLFEMWRSVDHPVQRAIAIDNGPGLPWPETHGLRRVQMDRNLGVAASWNLIIKMTADAPWWLITGFDVVFGAGVLANVANLMVVSQPRLLLVKSFNVFAINVTAVEKVGFFDENFVPAYFEDNDYAYRAKLAGVEIVDVDLGVSHAGSMTIRENYLLLRENSRTFPDNREYYRRKWGGTPGQESFTTPFGKPGADIRSWTPSIMRMREQAWR